MNELKTRVASVMIAVFAILGFGALSTPASAYSVSHCQSPYSTGTNGYWKYMKQKCYVNYNWYEEIYSGKQDGYKLAYSWTENTISGAKQHFKSYNLKYA